MPFNKITNLYTYLYQLQGKTFIITVYDDASVSWNDNLQSLLERCGLKGGFGYRDSYIGFVDKGKVVYENFGHETLEYFNGQNIYVRSSGYEHGVTNSIISVDGIDYSIKSRGLNIVVLNDGKVIDSVSFDTWSDSLSCSR